MFPIRSNKNPTQKLFQQFVKLKQNYDVLLIYWNSWCKLTRLRWSAHLHTYSFTRLWSSSNKMSSNRPHWYSRKKWFPSLHVILAKIRDWTTATNVLNDGYTQCVTVVNTSMHQALLRIIRHWGNSLPSTIVSSILNKHWENEKLCAF